MSITGWAFTDMIMIKDNHADMSGGITAAVSRVQDYLKRSDKDLKIEVEVRDLEQLNEVLSIQGVDRVMLDNFTSGIDDGSCKKW